MTGEMSAFPTLRAAPVAGRRPVRGSLRAAGFGLVLVLFATACGIRLPRLPVATPTIPPLPQTSILFDDRGHLITALHAGEDRTLIPLSQMPVITRDAVVAAEDERFYSHHGFDLKAIARATLSDTPTGRIVEGGSTITQQLVKNTIGTDERTLGRKIREAELAYQLESRYTKDQILAMYLNTVYFGQGAYGIEAAATTYFSRPAARLNLTQSALLAALIASPSHFDPVFHASAAIAQRNEVLERMHTLGMIDGTAYADAVNRPLGLVTEKDQPRYPAPYFVDYVKRWFLSNPAFGATAEQRYDLLFKGGLRIYTTVDLKLPARGRAGHRVDPGLPERPLRRDDRAGPATPERSRPWWAGATSSRGRTRWPS